jgi:hypothetical protein
MTAYVIVDNDMHDPVGNEEYKKLAPVVVELFGGKYIALAAAGRKHSKATGNPTIRKQRTGEEMAEFGGVPRGAGDATKNDQNTDGCYRRV